MPNLKVISLDHRAIVSLTGEDRVPFLQGLVSADIARVTGSRAHYGALLTPQGKFLYDFFIAAQGETLLLEIERAGRDDFIRRLLRFKLRSKVTLTPNDDLNVYALVGDGAASALDLLPEAGLARDWQGGKLVNDPRLAEAGLRAWLPDRAGAALGEAGFTPADRDSWDAGRIALGLPDGSRDLVPDKTILLEAGFDELQGVDWQKGCFMGQEVTARSKYRGQIKKRLMPVAIDGPPPPTGTLLYWDEREAGEMRSHCGQFGLAVIRLDCFAEIATRGGAMTAEGVKLTPRKPDWAEFG